MNVPKKKESLIQKNPIEMDSNLLQEFNLNKEQNHINKNNFPENNLIQQNNLPTNQNKINTRINSNANISELHDIKKSLNNSLNNHLQENEFLLKIAESDKQLLDSISEDIEKINRQIYSITDKNRTLREEILEYRRKINMEKDNLIKSTNKLYGQTNDLIHSKGIIN